MGFNIGTPLVIICFLLFTLYVILGWASLTGFGFLLLMSLRPTYPDITLVFFWGAVSFAPSIVFYNHFQLEYYRLMGVQLSQKLYREAPVFLLSPLLKEGRLKNIQRRVNYFFALVAATLIVTSICLCALVVNLFDNGLRIIKHYFVSLKPVDLTPVPVFSFGSRQPSRPRITIYNIDLAIANFLMLPLWAQIWWNQGINETRTYYSHACADFKDFLAYLGFKEPWELIRDNFLAATPPLSPLPPLFPLWAFSFKSKIFIPRYIFVPQLEFRFYTTLDLIAGAYPVYCEFLFVKSQDFELDFIKEVKAERAYLSANFDKLLTQMVRGFVYTSWNLPWPLLGKIFERKEVRSDLSSRLFFSIWYACEYRAHRGVARKLFIYEARMRATKTYWFSWQPERALYWEHARLAPYLHRKPDWKIQSRAAHLIFYEFMRAAHWFMIRKMTVQHLLWPANRPVTPKFVREAPFKLVNWWFGFIPEKLELVLNRFCYPFLILRARQAPSHFKHFELSFCFSAQKVKYGLDWLEELKRKSLKGLLMTKSRKRRLRQLRFMALLVGFCGSLLLTLVWIWFVTTPPRGLRAILDKADPSRPLRPKPPRTSIAQFTAVRPILVWILETIKRRFTEKARAWAWHLLNLGPSVSRSGPFNSIHITRVDKWLQPRWAFEPKGYYDIYYPAKKKTFENLKFKLQISYFYFKDSLHREPTRLNGYYYSARYRQGDYWGWTAWPRRWSFLGLKPKFDPVFEAWMKAAKQVSIKWWEGLWVLHKTFLPWVTDRLLKLAEMCYLRDPRCEIPSPPPQPPKNFLRVRDLWHPFSHLPLKTFVSLGPWYGWKYLCRGPILSVLHLHITRQIDFFTQTVWVRFVYPLYFNLSMLPRLLWGLLWKCTPRGVLQLLPVDKRPPFQLQNVAGPYWFWLRSLRFSYTYWSLKLVLWQGLRAIRFIILAYKWNYLLLPKAQCFLWLNASPILAKWGGFYTSFLPPLWLSVTLLSGGPLFLQLLIRLKRLIPYVYKSTKAMNPYTFNLDLFNSSIDLFEDFNGLNFYNFSQPATYDWDLVTMSSEITSSFTHVPVSSSHFGYGGYWGPAQSYGLIDPHATVKPLFDLFGKFQPPTHSPVTPSPLVHKNDVFTGFKARWGDYNLFSSLNPSSTNTNSLATNEELTFKKIDESLQLIKFNNGQPSSESLAGFDEAGWMGDRLSGYFNEYDRFGFWEYLYPHLSDFSPLTAELKVPTPPKQRAISGAGELDETPPVYPFTHLKTFLNSNLLETPLTNPDGSVAKFPCRSLARFSHFKKNSDKTPKKLSITESDWHHLLCQDIREEVWQPRASTLAPYYRRDRSDKRFISYDWRERDPASGPIKFREIEYPGLRLRMADPKGWGWGEWCEPKVWDSLYKQIADPRCEKLTWAKLNKNYDYGGTSHGRFPLNPLFTHERYRTPYPGFGKTDDRFYNVRFLNDPSLVWSGNKFRPFSSYPSRVRWPGREKVRDLLRSPDNTPSSFNPYTPKPKVYNFHHTSNETITEAYLKKIQVKRGLRGSVQDIYDVGPHWSLRHFNELPEFSNCSTTFPPNFTGRVFNDFLVDLLRIVSYILCRPLDQWNALNHEWGLGGQLALIFKEFFAIPRWIVKALPQEMIAKRYSRPVPNFHITYEPSICWYFFWDWYTYSERLVWVPLLYVVRNTLFRLTRVWIWWEAHPRSAFGMIRVWWNLIIRLGVYGTSSTLITESLVYPKYFRFSLDPVWPVKFRYRPKEGYDWGKWWLRPEGTWPWPHAKYLSRDKLILGSAMGPSDTLPYWYMYDIPNFVKECLISALLALQNLAARYFRVHHDVLPWDPIISEPRAPETFNDTHPTDNHWGIPVWFLRIVLPWILWGRVRTYPLLYYNHYYAFRGHAWNWWIEGVSRFDYQGHTYAHKDTENWRIWANWPRPNWASNLQVHWLPAKSNLEKPSTGLVYWLSGGDTLTGKLFPAFALREGFFHKQLWATLWERYTRLYRSFFTYILWWWTGPSLEKVELFQDRLFNSPWYFFFPQILPPYYAFLLPIEKFFMHTWVDEFEWSKIFIYMTMYMRRAYRFIPSYFFPTETLWWEKGYLVHQADLLQDEHAYDDLFVLWRAQDFEDVKDRINEKLYGDPEGHYDAHDYEVEELE